MLMDKLVSKLRVGLSHLCEQKFRHNFQGSLDQFCKRHIETTVHFCLHCSNCSNGRKKEPFLQKLVTLNILHGTKKTKLLLKQVLLFESKDLHGKENALIIDTTIECNITMKTFKALFL